jgi:hypothetical protein
VNRSAEKQPTHITEDFGFVLRQKEIRARTNRRGFLRIRASCNEENQSGDGSELVRTRRDIDSFS